MSGKPSMKTAIIWRKKWEKTREWTAPEEDLRAEEEGDAEGEDDGEWDTGEAAALNEDEVEERDNEEMWEMKEKGVKKENMKPRKSVKEDKVRSYRGKYRKRMARWVESALNSTKISQHHHHN